MISDNPHNLKKIMPQQHIKAFCMKIPEIKEMTKAKYLQF